MNAHWMPAMQTKTCIATKTASVSTPPFHSKDTKLHMYKLVFKCVDCSLTRVQLHCNWTNPGRVMLHIPPPGTPLSTWLQMITHLFSHCTALHGARRCTDVPTSTVHVPPLKTKPHTRNVMPANMNPPKMHETTIVS